MQEKSRQYAQTILKTYSSKNNGNGSQEKLGCGEIGHFTVVCLVTWPRMQVRLEVTLL